MSTRMLIDARHPEETRVAVVRGNRIEELDYESITKKQLKGNIYLAKVTRVEPSLQACFVEYGGNRHGFLAFSEIHPDYYQIPLADREALLRAEAEEAEKDAEREENRRSRKPRESDEDTADVEHIGGEDDFDGSRTRRASSLRRKYNIQEVIKRRQVLLVQVVKEERGSKGAALTTYLSLAGRYCVLMPNSTSGGGISRKIANQADRKKLKSVMSALDVPEGMGCIIRTAGLNRTKAEIKRDFDYLLRLWDEIRALTLKSVAPKLIYEEANLIKRTIRDLYSRDIDEVMVEGEEGYKLAKEFMKLLTPSHAKRVRHYKDRIPLFHRYQVESQLESMYSPTVQLKSGGYIVINPTEALVAIDINSGRSTKEHNIEETALKTNLEASEEIARQLRLRDLAGLIVIDFIDMEERANNRAVEKRLKDALKADRARIQVGRISSFGLLEMSRQRLRPNLLEASMVICEHCGGTGTVRSIESAALAILRALEEEGIRERTTGVTVHVPPKVAIYLLNQKRAMLSEIEIQYGYRLSILPEENLDGELFRITHSAAGEDEKADTDHAIVQVAEQAEEPQAEEAERRADAGQESADQPSRRRRRRGRRGGRRSRGEDQAKRSIDPESAQESDRETRQEEPATPKDAPPAADEAQDQKKKRPRRRKRKSAAAPDAAETATQDETAAPSPGTAEEALPKDSPDAPPDADTAPQKPRRRVRRRKTAAATEAQDHVQKAPETELEPDSEPETAGVEAEQDAAAKKPRKRRRKEPPATAEVAASTVDAAAEPDAPVAHAQITPQGEVVEPARTEKPKRGWWRKSFGT